MGQLRKRHSWPSPSKSNISPSSSDLDNDPFSYFISSEVPSHQSNEIEIPEAIPIKRRTRSLPLLHRRDSSRRRLSASRRSPVRALMQWIARMEQHYFHYSQTPPPLPGRVPHNSPIEPLIVTITPPSAEADGLSRSPTTSLSRVSSPPLRGRGDIRHGSSIRVSKTVNKPARRPRVWREPSTGIWSIEEEARGSEDENGLGISHLG